MDRLYLYFYMHIFIDTQPLIMETKIFFILVPILKLSTTSDDVDMLLFVYNSHRRINMIIRQQFFLYVMIICQIYWDKFDIWVHHFFYWLVFIFGTKQTVSRSKNIESLTYKKCHFIGQWNINIIKVWCYKTSQNVVS